MIWGSNFNPRSEIYIKQAYQYVMQPLNLSTSTPPQSMADGNGSRSLVWNTLFVHFRILLSA